MYLPILHILLIFYANILIVFELLGFLCYPTKMHFMGGYWGLFVPIFMFNMVIVEVSLIIYNLLYIV